MWLDPTSKNSFLTEVPENNSDITSFSDFDPKRIGQHTFLGVADHYPTYKKSQINGLPSLSFDATGATAYNVLQLESGGTLVAGNEDRTIIFVVKPVSPAESGSSHLMTRNSSGFIGFGSSNGSNRLALRDLDFGDNQTFSAAGSVQYGTPHIISIIGDENGTRAWSDSTQILNVATKHFHWTINGSGGYKFKLGADSTAEILPERAYSGDLGEIILFNRALNDTQREIVEKYLSAKWGIDLN